jgi:hypothetical protein
MNLGTIAVEMPCCGESLDVPLQFVQGKGNTYRVGIAEQGYTLMDQHAASHANGVDH